MTVVRMDNVGIVVDDLAAVTAFFVALGMELEGQMTVEGPWVDGCVGLQGVRCDIAMLRTPDGHSKIELARYQRPEAVRPESEVPVNTVGMRRIMFAVEDVDAVVDRLRTHGGDVVGEIVQYEDIYRLCYFRGPEGIVIGLAEERRGRG